VAHQKSSSSERQRQVGGVSDGGAWSADRDVSDSDDDEICVVDDDVTTNNNDISDDNGRHSDVVSPPHNNAASYHANSAYTHQLLSPTRSSADIYPSHKLQGKLVY